jgi:hypothetical protein
MRYLLPGIAAVLLIAGQGRAQVSNPNSFAPNAYNRSAQPLSPYLNMLRGGNPAVNYFYGVRPGTQPWAFTGMFTPSSGPRQTFFQGADQLTDLLEDPREVGKVAPTGHATTFNNTLNYFGPTSGQFFSKGQQQQQRRH